MVNSPVDPVEYINVMKKTRRRRTFFFSTVLVYVPALWITYKISPTNRAMGTVFAIWVAILIVATFMAALSKCPRCGNYFHMHGITLLILRKCLHCQLHISSDNLP
ncbi:MAG: hypothetical protein WCI45_02305 [Desulfuromonadales bacterium]